MKKILLFTALAAVLAGAGYAGTSCTNSYAMSGPDTLKINTTELGADLSKVDGQGRRPSSGGKTEYL